MFKKKICFVVSNITSNKCEYITYKNYPNLKLWKAILMSISIPVVFPSVKYNDNYYVDGALYDQIGLYKIKQKYIKDNNMIVITYININNNKNNNDKDKDEDDKIYDLIKYITKCSYTYLTENVNNNKYILLKDYKYFYCYMSDTVDEKISNYFDLVLSKEKIIQMINNGYNYAVNKDIQ